MMAPCETKIAIGLQIGIVLTIAAATAPASAQTVDLGALQDLFDEPITTSVTGAPQRVSDVPAAMIVISGEQIRRSGALNLAETLRGYAGIDVMRNGTQQYDVSMRGGNQPYSPRLLVMVDGRQVYLDHYGLTSWSNLGIELSEIRQVEIVKGPMSALFGFNAASGVINIITYNPQSDHIAAASGEVGTDGTYSVSGVGTLRLGEEAGVRVSGGYSKQDEFAFVGPASPLQPHRENLAIDAGASLAERVNARLSYSYSNSEQSTLAVGFIPADMAFRTHDVQGKLSADTGIGILDASVEYKALNNRYSLARDGNYDGAFSNNVLIARAQDTVKFGARDTVRATLEYRYDDFSVVPDLAGKVKYDVYSGGVMWDHGFSDSVSLNLAGRIDHLVLGHSGAIRSGLGFSAADFNQAFTDWSANAGLVIKPDEDSTVRLLAGRGVQSPSLVALGIGLQIEPIPGVVAEFLGDPSLGSTIVESAEAGYTRLIDAIAGSINVTGFYSNTKMITAFDRMLPVFVPGTGVVVNTRFLADAGEFKSYGIEMVADGKLGSAFSWRLDYTYDVVEEHFQPQVLSIDRPHRALTPRHKVGFRLGYDHGPLTVNARAYMRSKVVFPLDGRVSSTSLGLDGRIGWRLIDRVELYAVGENLTGSDFIDNGYARQETRARIGARFGL